MVGHAVDMADGGRVSAFDPFNFNIELTVLQWMKE
jgi:hypothetical protein